MKKRPFFAACLIAVSLFQLSGCQTKPQTADPSATPTPVQQTAAPSPTQPADGPVTVVDQAGRTVEVTQPVERIAVCWYMANDFVLALGLGDKLVAVGPKDDFQAMVVPAMADMDTVGKGRPDMEKLATVNPGLFVHTVADTDNLAAVEALDIPMIQIDPETIEKTLEAYQIIGEATGTADRAQMLTELYHKITDQAAVIVGDTKEADRPTFVLVGKDPGMVANGGMMQAEMIVNGGGVNLAQDLESSELWPEAGTEQVFAWDPDYLFVSATSTYTVEDIVGDPAWADLRAVKDGNVFLIPSTLHNWENPGMATCLGTLWAATKLYPEDGLEEALDTVVGDFYQTVYGLTLDRETLGY